MNKAQELLKKQTLANLVEQFELTEIINDPGIYTVRGWLMDELEARNPKAYDRWMDSMEDSPRRFFLNRR